ncbi:trimeric intracellular cation channel family protein [Pigmentibacter sp. JX0631]|uniref:trimeric intracellular cation channel family protein n=1 Tax=Pigmentibacter sp. JX0631 TaxID=2976982 RepID=UPI0024698C6A|nr:trimeric intracellular cation channel family protein [Pigmentibacter sp. JX0631]WGL59335.1 trimeric intracellular cation channel family protein [Pigmentibacter sp. JX0631]
MVFNVIDYSGSFAFCISGASIAVAKKMDIFGIFVMAVIAGFGGGCLRDIILGNTPPTVFNTPIYWIIALLATVVVLAFKRQHRYFDKMILLFDALGLAFFTVAGVKVALKSGLLNYQCILMGVITACFGGVLRDVIVNRVPYLFQKEIYGAFAVMGGIIYFVLDDYLPPLMLDIIVILFIFVSRMISIWKNWNLPKARKETLQNRRLKFLRRKKRTSNLE